MQTSSKGYLRKKIHPIVGIVLVVIGLYVYYLPYSSFQIVLSILLILIFLILLIILVWSKTECVYIYGINYRLAHYKRGDHWYFQLQKRSNTYPKEKWDKVEDIYPFSPGEMPNDFVNAWLYASVPAREHAELVANVETYFQSQIVIVRR